MSERGVALPMALFCLVALAALLSGLVLVASTELVVSLAHRDSVEDRYLAEGAVHAWLADRGEDLVPEVIDAWLPPGAAVPVKIEVERLADPSGSDENTVFAIRAAPLRGGSGTRSAVAFARTRTAVPAPFEPLVAAPITAGGGGRIERLVVGGATVLDGSDSLCSEPDHQASFGVVTGEGTAFEVQDPGAVQGELFHHTDSGNSLAREILGGHRIRDLAWNADVRYGRYFNAPAFTAGALIRSGSPDPRRDWGCPAGVLAELPAGAVASCAAGAGAGGGADTWRTIAIDAANDTVKISAHHAQGILIVVNGHLHMSGSFVFRGLVLVEGSVVLSGGGAGWAPSVEGAVIAGGPVVVLDGRDPDTGFATAHRRSIRFDRCALTAAVAAFNTAGPDRWLSRRVQGRPHAWSSVLD